MFYGFGLYADKIGDYVRKPMGECSGREILEELLHHLKFDADLERILDSSMSSPAGCRSSQASF